MSDYCNDHILKTTIDGKKLQLEFGSISDNFGEYHEAIRSACTALQGPLIDLFNANASGKLDGILVDENPEYEKDEITIRPRIRLYASCFDYEESYKSSCVVDAISQGDGRIYLEFYLMKPELHDLSCPGENLELVMTYKRMRALAFFSEESISLMLGKYYY